MVENLFKRGLISVGNYNSSCGSKFARRSCNNKGDVIGAEYLKKKSMTNDWTGWSRWSNDLW